MICKQCKDEGKKSTVHEYPGCVTDAYYPPFYDEDGKRHHHDGNISSSSYKCSNGHEWAESSIERCWCGWPEKESKKIG